MSTLLYWALGVIASLLLFSAIITLGSDVETSPAPIPLTDFDPGAQKPKWLRIQNAAFVWAHGVIAYRAKELGSEEKTGVKLLIPLVTPTVAGELRRRKLTVKDVIAVAQMDEDLAWREFKINRKTAETRGVSVHSTVVLRREFKWLSKKGRAKLKSNLPGIESVPAMQVGGEVFQKGSARGMLATGAVMMVIWLFWRRQRKRAWSRDPAAPAAPRADPRFHPVLVPMFSILGKIAKADGRVSPEEIQAVQEFMVATEMDGPHRKKAIEVFNRAKDDSRDIGSYAIEFVAAEPRVDMRVSAYALMFKVACADGNLGSVERRLLESLVGPLGLPSDAFGSAHRAFVGSAKPLDKCYETLGCSESSSDDEVKRAYREKMRTFHPDKLQSKDLPPEFHDYAKQQTQGLQEAYETIMKARG